MDVVTVKHLKAFFRPSKKQILSNILLALAFRRKHEPFSNPYFKNEQISINKTPKSIFQLFLLKSLLKYSTQTF